MNSINNRKRNLVVMVDVLKREGPMTQTVLKEYINLKASTTSYLVNDLKRLGLVIDSGIITQDGGPGKPGNLLKLNNDFAQFIGCYVENNLVNVYVIGLDGTTLSHKSIFVDNYTKVKQALIDIIVTLCEKNSKIRGIGIAMKGVVLLDGTIQVKYGEGKDEAWKLEGLLQHLKQHFPEIPVVIENDANCSAILYQHEEREIELDLLLYLLNKTPFGIGCGILVNGQILKGATGVAGEYFEKGKRIQKLIEGISDQNIYAEKFIESIFSHISTSVYLLNPKKVVISGNILNDISTTTIKKIGEIIKDYDLPVDVILTKGNEDLGPAKGAALIAMNDYISSFIGKVGAR